MGGVIDRLDWRCSAHLVSALFPTANLLSSHRVEPLVPYTSHDLYPPFGTVTSLKSSALEGGGS
jgi:hypothetical protein